MNDDRVSYHLPYVYVICLCFEIHGAYYDHHPAGNCGRRGHDFDAASNDGSGACWGVLMDVVVVVVVVVVAFSACVYSRVRTAVASRYF